MDGEADGHRGVFVVVDDRERGAGVGEALGALPDVQVAWRRLLVGDYVVDNRLVFERKTLLDFAVSVVDGRLFTQCSRLAESPLCPVLLLEGTGAELAGRGFQRDSLTGALVTATLVFGVPVLRSLGPAETARILVMAARQVARVEAGRVRRAGYRPRTRRGRQAFLLQGLPGTGPVLAARLLERFGSVEAVVSAPEEELCAVAGIGPGRAAAIRDAVRESAAAYGFGLPDGAEAEEWQHVL